MPRKLTLQEFTQRSAAIHNNKYSYSKCIYTNGGTKVVINCPEHGDFTQLPQDHIKGVGCRLCGIKQNIKKQQMTQNEFITAAKEVHKDNYNYDKVVYTGSHKIVAIQCLIHGEFKQKAYSHLSGNGCSLCGTARRAKSHVISQETFLLKCKKVHGNLYDYSNTVYVRWAEKLSINCRTHGEFWQTPHGHLAGNGCPTCRYLKSSTNNTKTTEEFVSQATAVHKDFDYSLVNYVNAKTGVTIICKNGHKFSQKPNDHLDGHGCPRCSISGPSKPEEELKVWLESLGETVSSNCRKTLGNRQEVDLVVGSLALEYNGLRWHSDKFGKDKSYHKEKTALAKANGLQMIHIFEDEWLLQEAIVKSRIQAKLGKSTKHYARKLQVESVTWKVAKDFYTKTHLQGAGAPGKSYALTDTAGNILACLSVGTRSKVLEIFRYASIGSVIGGFGKLFKHYLKEHPEVNHIISYSDLRWGEGKLYATQGFKRLEDTSPGYFWVRSGKRFSRVKFQKHKLKGQLKVFDAVCTEEQNMRNNGYSKIFDCGHAKWEWTRDA